jgi:50S ribosomal protein L16 3-hydroxylase
MLSFAVPGGGTGPHVDQYDVFLCQLLGRREWRLAGKSAARQEVRHGDLSLLQPFHDPAPYRAEVGDVLYLPPGVPHWGVAADHCMTLSIGMRAPTRDELRRTFAREFAASANPFALAGEATFYTDPDLQAGEAAPGAITQAAITRCRELCEPSVDVSDESLAITLGCTVTELKAWLEPQQVADEDIAEDLRRAPEDAVWSVHGMSRIAWSTLPGRTIVFANGRWRHVDEQ